MPLNSNIAAFLKNPDYLPIIKNNITYYGGSQMWFPARHRYNSDTLIRNYGCGTIAIADMFLYFAIQNDAMQTSLSEQAISLNREISYPNYISYVRLINKQYIRTLPFIAVIGPVAAGAVNSYSGFFGLHLHASWKLKLNYYDMYDLMEEMLHQDIPVILSVGPNTPNLWGNRGITFYEHCEINYYEPGNEADKAIRPYYYKAVKHNIHSHYVTATGIIKDDINGKIMLRISSWGHMYYINYEEYRDYIESRGGTFTSSLLHVAKKAD